MQFAKYPTQPQIIDNTDELTERMFLDSGSSMISVEQNLLRSRPRQVEKLKLDLVVEQTCEKDTHTITPELETPSKTARVPKQE